MTTNISETYGRSRTSLQLSTIATCKINKKSVNLSICFMTWLEDLIAWPKAFDTTNHSIQLSKWKALSNTNHNCMANLLPPWGSSEGWEWHLTFCDEVFDKRRPPRQRPGSLVVSIVYLISRWEVCLCYLFFDADNVVLLDFLVYG